MKSPENTETTLKILSQQMKETSKWNAPLSSCTAQA
jgi:hypothetical protein